MDRLQPAYILARRLYSNTSLLLEFFTPGHGRLAAIAKGARTSAGKGGGFLQPFVPLEIIWKGRGEVRTLSKAESTGQGILTEGKRLYCGFYLNELLSRLIPRDDPHPELFHLYDASLRAIAATEAFEPLLRRFEAGLLEGMGYGMQWTHCTGGEPVRPELRYHYALEEGPVRAADGALSGSTLLALAGMGGFSPDATREARLLMRRALARYLGDKPLKSRELFRSVYGQGGS
ncbi:MAG: DNA repair protein RecO [Gammaproteobacteria bacterium]|nr:DNA repair protein RecO [Gammaproteobacteria bacterium]MBU1655429.1 DNA repair protein RecO [Gammaproteobacteria bacterium]MBU1960220.1 DNA repair protein RecO [Gammaproteobacteria bacterium]